MSGGGWRKGEEEPFLAKLPSGPHRLPRDLVRDNQRRRLLAAALDVFAERGYAAATVTEVIRRARVSRATFYEAFADKEECLVALYESVTSWLWEEVAGAITEAADWPGEVRAAIVKTVELLAEDARLAVVCAVLAPSVRVSRVRARHEQLVGEACRGLRAGRVQVSHGEELPEITEPALVHGALYMIGRSIVYREGPDPPTLAVELADLILIPYSG